MLGDEVHLKCGGQCPPFFFEGEKAMSRVGVIIGISAYARETQLPCCAADADAVAEFLKNTSRFDNIAIIKNATASQIREQMRSALPDNTDEVFFYFSGHGGISNADSFLCASDYDASRPNETGISRQDLLGMLRSANPELVVMVIDACHSGSALIKSSEEFAQIPKVILKNVIQIAACMEDQVSFTGRPLSAFTDKFLRAVLRKDEGSVYYSDIINTLHDDYSSSIQQVPYFVQQGSFRDLIVDDTKQISGFAAYLDTLFKADAMNDSGKSLVLRPEPSLLDRLVEADKMLVRKESLDQVISDFFDKLVEQLSIDEFEAMYSLDTVVHSDYQEFTSKAFITRCLSSEARPDRFVSAELKYKKQPLRGLLGISNMFMEADERTVDSYDLSLNYELDRAQIKFSLTPKFTVLKKIILVVSCAPSLTKLYVFEVLTEHARTGFNQFEVEGKELVRRWYERKWDGDVSAVINSIKEKLIETANAQIASALASVKSK